MDLQNKLRTVLETAQSKVDVIGVFDKLVEAIQRVKDDGEQLRKEVTNRFGIITARITEVYQQVVGIDTRVAAIEAHKPKDGYTPVKGVDYTDGKDGYTPVKGKDYFDGIDGRDGIDGKKGMDGKDGRDGKDGKRGPAGKAGKNGSPDTPLQVRDKLQTLAGEERLDASAIKNIPSGGRIGTASIRDFIKLRDTPRTYTGQGGKIVKVKANETGLEFGEGGGGAETDPVWTEEKTDYYTKDDVDEGFLPKGEDIYVPDLAKTRSFTLTRDGEGNITDIVYEGGRTVSFTRNDGVITGWGDGVYDWAVERTDDTITGVTVSEV
jgi:hypothetical protein